MNENKGSLEVYQKDEEIQGLRKQTQILNEQLAAVIEQQQQYANSFDRYVQVHSEVKSLGL